MNYYFEKSGLNKAYCFGEILVSFKVVMPIFLCETKCKIGPIPAKNGL